MTTGRAEGRLRRRRYGRGRHNRCVRIVVDVRARNTPVVPDACRKYATRILAQTGMDTSKRGFQIDHHCLLRGAAAKRRVFMGINELSIRPGLGKGRVWRHVPYNWSAVPLLASGSWIRLKLDGCNLPCVTNEKKKRKREKANKTKRRTWRHHPGLLRAGPWTCLLNLSD